MKDKNENSYSLQLLDDSCGKHNSDAWQDLTSSAIQQQKKTTKKAPPSPKVFSASPTLRAMMQEYNRPTARLAPLKPAGPQSSADKLRSAEEFTFEPIAQIQVPGIPGKILRPMKKTKNGIR